MAMISMTELADYGKCSVFAYFRYQAQAQLRKQHGILEKWDEDLHRLAFYLFHQVQGGTYPSAHLMKQAWGRMWAGQRTKEDVMFHVGSWRDELRKRERKGLRIGLDLQESLKGRTGTPILIGKAYELPFGKHVISGTIDLLREAPDGALELVDFQTDDRPLALYIQNDYGLTGAAWAVRKLLGVDPARVTFYHLPSGNVFSAARGQADFRMMHNAITAVDKLQAAEVILPSLDANCVGCAYLAPCQRKEWLRS